MFNPQNEDGIMVPEPLYMICPVETCDGMVVAPKGGSVNSDPFYRCGECGTPWLFKADLDRDISSIIAKYPYRASCYVESKDGWEPVVYDEIPTDYSEKVELEWKNIQSNESR